MELYWCLPAAASGTQQPLWAAQRYNRASGCRTQASHSYCKLLQSYHNRRLLTQQRLPGNAGPIDCSVATVLPTALPQAQKTPESLASLAGIQPLYNPNKQFREPLTCQHKCSQWTGMHFRAHTIEDATGPVPVARTCLLNATWDNPPTARATWQPPISSVNFRTTAAEPLSMRSSCGWCLSCCSLALSLSRWLAQATGCLPHRRIASPP